jgi:hypothetical protein
VAIPWHDSERARGRSGEHIRARDQKSHECSPSVIRTLA